jgi:hypothetical protein
LEFEESSVDFVDDDDGFDTFTEGLTEDSFGLDADSFNTVDDDEGTVSDSEGSSDFRGEIDVAGRINQIDQESVVSNAKVTRLYSFPSVF